MRGADVRVEGGRVEALVLPELRQHLVRGGDESRPRPVPAGALAQERGHRLLVVRVGVAVQEAHRDRGAGRKALHRGARLVEVERTQDSAVPGHAFVDLQRAAARNKGRGFQGGDVVEDGAVGAGDLEHVPEPGRGQHPDLGPPSLQDRVRADGDAVDEALHLPEVDAEAFEHVEDRAGRVRWGGRDFRVAKRPGRIVEQRRVGEGSADVHTDAVSSLSIRHASFVLPGVRFARDARFGLSRRKRTLCGICGWGRTAARERACGSRFGSDIEPM